MAEEYFVTIARGCVGGGQSAAHDDPAGAVGQGRKLRKQTIHRIERGVGAEDGADGLRTGERAGNTKLCGKDGSGLLVLLKCQQGRTLR